MKLRKTGRFVLILAFVAQSFGAFSQSDPNYLNYIRKYTASAVSEMYYSKIPASIIMAQALHESRYGTSELAVKANNHFGIKCQTGWDGKNYTYQDDDANTCFRMYESPEQSFRDHSNFLMTRPRYAFLFTLDQKDYSAWAHGLKKAGYATNPKYGPILIKLIEDYKLYLLDTIRPILEPMKSIASGRSIPNHVKKAASPEPRIYRRNRIEYCVVQPGDDVKKLTEEYSMFKREIRRFNEMGKKDEVTAGQEIYLQPKRKKAESGYTTHTVEAGETMHSISQIYGIKLKWLYKRNRMEKGAEPKVGQELWLRGKKPATK